MDPYKSSGERPFFGKTDFGNQFVARHVLSRTKFPNYVRPEVFVGGFSADSIPSPLANLPQNGTGAAANPSRDMKCVQSVRTKLLDLRPGDRRLNTRKCAVLFSSLLLVVCLTPVSQGQIDDATKKLAHDIFKQLIEINTTDSVGNITTASDAMAQRFREAGFAGSDIQILGPNDRKKNLVVRLHGTGKDKPLLLIGHLDVVEAHRDDWTTDPFTFVEEGGFFYGRGTQDMKSGDAIMATTLIRFKREGYTPKRDIVLALTADEEGGKSNGVDWLLKNHRDLIDAEVVFNHDGGGILSDHGKPVMMTVDATEKLYADFQVSVTNPGGHSSLPRPDNAIYSLTDALSRLEHYQFPFELNEVTRVYYERMAKVETPERSADISAMLRSPTDANAISRLSRDPIDNSTIHTTCVATRLNAGHANNALPQRAEANVNCRILPGHSAEEIRQKLIEVFADPTITVQYVDNSRNVLDRASDRQSFPPPPLRRDVFGPLEKITEEIWPDTPLIPDMAPGASDGVYTMAVGLPTYGISGIAIDRDDIRAHGRDERLGIDSYYKGLDFYYRFLKAVTSQ
jgi:acetylornithine deacetylase/succinyl-diaminopimelate desuccinylase-like protein